MACVMGFFSYNRRFIPHFSELSYDQIDGERQADPMESVFMDLKEMLSQTPIFVHPQSQEEFVLDIDAINEDICAVLSQVKN